MFRIAVFVVIALEAVQVARAQWEIQTSNTSADLRGIHSVGNGAWASGTNGTVLRTEDGGYVWQSCAIPPGAEKLDFRGIQAFDTNTAIVMSSGKGELSRLYKTTDGCHSWKLIFSNPYSPDGFFDAILFLDPQHGLLFGDPSPHSANTPVEYPGDFRLRVTADGGKTWGPVSASDWPALPGKGLHVLPHEAAFAASNSSIASLDGWFWFATSTSRIAFRRLYEGTRPPGGLFQSAYCAGALDPVSKECGQPWIDFQNSIAPVVHSSPSSGIFSIWFATTSRGVAVGGDYLKPERRQVPRHSRSTVEIRGKLRRPRRTAIAPRSLTTPPPRPGSLSAPTAPTSPPTTGRTGVLFAPIPRCMRRRMRIETGTRFLCPSWSAHTVASESSIPRL
jgi:hypothetical protein